MPSVIEIIKNTTGDIQTSLFGAVRLSSGRRPFGKYPGHQASAFDCLTREIKDENRRVSEDRAELGPEVLAHMADFDDRRAYHSKVGITPQRVDQCPIASAQHLDEVINFGSEG